MNRFLWFRWFGPASRLAQVHWRQAASRRACFASGQAFLPQGTRLLSMGCTSLGTSQTGPVTGSTGSSEDARDSETKQASPEAIRRARLFSVATGAACAFFGASYILYHKMKVQAAELEEASGSAVEEEEKVAKKHIGFHDRHVSGYEDRIRAYSTPDKIFRYFATLNVWERDGSQHIYMTPRDFLRSITRGDLQPEGLGLDQFRNVSIQQWEKEHARGPLDPDSMFSRLGHYGLISFSDYLFLLTILATPMKNFAIAFKMFDLNGDGEVEAKEFDMVRQIILQSTAVGARHRDHLVTGNIAGSVGGALVEHFFGPKGDKKLTVEAFQEFHRQLRMEVLKLEFERFHPVNGRISERSFARLVLSYSDVNDQRRKKYLKRIKKAYPPVACPQERVGITFEDVSNFAEFLDNITDVEMALGMHSAAGASITVEDLKHVSRLVAGVELSSHLVEVIFVLFDENLDGELSYKEFMKVMKSQTTRGLEKSKELGFSRLMHAVMACSTKTIKDQIGIAT